MTDRNEGCKRWAAPKRQLALRAQRFGVRNHQRKGKGKNMKAGHFFAAIFLPAVLSLVNAKTPGRKGAGKGGKGTRFLATWRLCVISVPLLDASRKAALARGRQKLQFSPARLQLV